MQTTSFNQVPGPYERHVRRKLDNPLFTSGNTYDEAILREAQAKDHANLETFRGSFIQMVEEIVALDSEVESDVLLKLKSRLDEAYEVSSGLVGERSEYQASIKKLVKVIMQAIWKNIGDDPTAERELFEEEQGRAQHYYLLENPLVVDLLSPDSPVMADELVPTLLSESRESIHSVLPVFEVDQLVVIVSDARDYLAERQAAGVDVTEALAKLDFIQVYLAELERARLGSNPVSG
ncbi:MAG TPA: hypothetical protein ENJ84_00290 [Gammaproteobacteria bacterium]|nr:hypothetical protein [Gammaproteobacteria bacterium]